MTATTFDAAYYQRHYYNPRTAAVTRSEARLLADFIAISTKHAGVDVRRILDVGAGVGWIGRRIRNHFQKATYVGIEVSEHLCGKHGWTHASVVDYRARAPFDLVVCSDVLQYLDYVPATEAIRNLMRLCRGVLYFSALTQQDWDERCVQSRTDSNVTLRSGERYRSLLSRYFTPLGGGMHLRDGVETRLWELEHV